MTPPLPSLEEPAPGTCCPRCADPLRIIGFCAQCFEASLQAREAAAKADLDAAKRRARTWHLGRAVEQ